MSSNFCDNMSSPKVYAGIFLRSWGLFRQKVVKDKRNANIRLQSIKGRLGSLRDAELFPLPFGELFPLLL